MDLSPKAFRNWQKAMKYGSEDEPESPVDFANEQRRIEILDDLQNRRREDLENRYLWRLTSDNRPVRRRAALELSREVSNADDAAYITRRVAEVGQAKKWAEQKRQSKKGYLRRVGETISELPQQVAEGSTDILDRYQGLGRVIAGGDTKQSHVTFRNLLENAYTEQDPTNIERHNKAWKAARGGAKIAPQVGLGAVAYGGLGSLGVGATTAGQTFAPLRERLVMEGVKPSAATKLAAVTSAVEGAIETMVPVPGLGKSIAAEAGSKVGKKALTKAIGRFGAEYLVETSGEESLQGASEALASLAGAQLSGKTKGRSIFEVSREAVQGAGEAYGPMLPFSAIGGGIHIANLKVQSQILKMAEENHTPSRKEWMKLGLPSAEGMNKADRKAGIQLLAKQIKSATEEGKAPESPEAASTETYEEATRESELAPTPQEEQAQETEAAQKDQQDAELQQKSQEIPQVAEDVSLTSTKASIRDDVIRQARGEGPATGLESETVDQWLSEANQLIAEDHTLPNRLIDEMKKKPRPLSEVEHMVMQVHYRQLNNVLQSQSDKIQTAQSAVERAKATTDANLTESAIEEADKISEKLSWEIHDQETAAKLAGTKWGRAGVAQQVMLKKDYSPASLVRKRTVAKGTPLTSEEIQQAVDHGKKIQELEQKITELEKLAPQRQELDIEISRLNSEFKKQKRGIKKSAARQQVSDAWKSFKAQLPKFETGGSVANFLKGEAGSLDPEAIAAAANVIRAYVNLGAVTLSEVLANARAQLGVKYDNALVAFTEAWKEMLGNGEVQELRLNKDDTKGIVRIARQLQKSFVEAGYKDRNVIVGMVNQEIVHAIPNWTVTETIDALTGYGRYQEQQEDEVQKIISDINQQLIQVRKLEDLEQGTELPKGRRRHHPSEELKNLRKQVREAKKKAGYGQQSIEAYKKNLRTRLQAYEEKIRNKDFTKRVRQEPKQDEEVLDLKHKLEQVKSRARTEEQKFRRKQRTTAQKIIGVVPDTINSLRAYLISFDLSAVGRQGATFVLSHPTQAARNFRPMIEALKSEKEQFRYVDKLRERSKKAKYSYDQVGLALTLSQERLQKQEEAYLGNWTPYIPGVSASERAYTTFLSLCRADWYDLLVHNAAKYGEVTLDEAKILANFVNVATGRGNLGRLEPAAVALATIFFAPKYVASRFQYLFGVPLWKGNLKTKRVIAAEYVRTLTGLAAIYGMIEAAAAMYGDDDPRKPITNWDWRSSEFGKTKIGNTRIDWLFGLSQTTVLLGRMATGETKTIGGKVVPLSGKTIPYGGANRYDVLTRWMRTKFAPHITFAIDVGTGKTVVGEDVTASSIAYQSLVPLVGRDIYESMVEQGVPEGTALGMLAVFGTGVQNYSPRPHKMRRRRGRIVPYR